MVRHFSTIISAEHPTGPQFDADPVALMGKGGTKQSRAGPRCIVDDETDECLVAEVRSPGSSAWTKGRAGQGTGTHKRMHDMSRSTGRYGRLWTARNPARPARREKLFGAERGA